MGEGDGLAGAAVAKARLPDTPLPEADGARSPTGGISPVGPGVGFLASLRSQYARRFVALASVMVAQMSQAGSSQLSAASAWSLPRQTTHRRCRSPLSLACPQSGYACLDISETREKLARVQTITTNHVE